MSTIVVANAYDTSGNGGRKEVTLSNGWIIAAVWDSVSLWFRIYKSTDSGSTWSQICYQNNAIAVNNFAITSSGTKVYFINSNGTGMFSCPFDATTVANTDLAEHNFDSQTSIGQGCSIVVAPNGTLTAAWCSKNTNIPNSFNIRSATSTDGGVTWTKQNGTAGVDQISGDNTAGTDSINPCVVVNGSNNPSIFYQTLAASTQYFITCIRWTGSTWSPNTIASVVNYAQSNPTGIIKQYGSNIGRIWGLWDGLDATDTTKRNIHAAYSDDGGVTFSSQFKLTSGNTIDRQKPTLSESAFGDIYVFYQDGSNISYQICPNGSTTFGGLTTFAASGTNPAAMWRQANSFIGVVYMDASQVKFDKITLDAAPNAPVITSPTAEKHINTRTPTITWTFSDPDVGDTQSAFAIQILNNAYNIVIWDSGWITSTASSYVIPNGVIPSDGPFWVRMNVKDSSGLINAANGGGGGDPVFGNCHFFVETVLLFFGGEF